jgi:hypothetical protein
MSESTSSKRNKILGDDPNFVPHAFPIVELEIVHSHTTINKYDSGDESLASDDDFVKISKTESILTTKDKYFKIPLTEIIRRKERLPLWFIPFLNTYPLTNYSIVSTSNNLFVLKKSDNLIFSPFTLNNHLNIANKPNNEFIIYFKQDNVELQINQINQNIIF